MGNKIISWHHRNTWDWVESGPWSCKSSEGHRQGSHFTWTTHDFKNQTFFPCALNTTKFCLVLCKAYKVRSKTRSSPKLDVTLAVLDALLLIFLHLGMFHKHPTVPIHSMSHSDKENQFISVTPTSQFLGHWGGTTNKSEEHATALFACPEDWLCTLVPEEQAHCKSIMFPVARWMGKVPATSCNPFVMPIAGCYEDVR